MLLAVLLSPLLLFKLLPQPMGFFANAFHAFYSLPLFVHGSAFHDPLHDLPCVDPSEVVGSDFLVDAHSLGGSVRIIRQGNEARGAVIDGVRKSVGTRGQVRASGSEGSPEDHCVYVLWRVRRTVLCGEEVLTLHCRTQRPRS